MERLQELLARLNDADNPLTADELTELSGLIDGQREAVVTALDEDPSAENISLANEIADAMAAVQAENDRRDAEAEAQRAQATEALARLQPPAEVEAEQTAETHAETEQVPEPVAAAAPPRVRLSRVLAHRPVEREPRDEPETRAVPLTASADAGGGELDVERLARQFENVVTALRRGGRGLEGEKVIVASADWSDHYPVEQRVSAKDDGGNNTRIVREGLARRRGNLNTILASAAKLEQAPQALTAAGGICAPVAVDYSIPVIGSAARPVRDALPSFGADRGGIRFVDPTGFTIAALASGVAIWTAANDASPGGANTGPGGTGTGPTTKPSVEINCGNEVQVLVEAITEQLTIGNMRAKFNPEQVATAMSYLDIAFARTAEQELLRQLVAGSIAVTTAQKYGAARDLLSNIGLAAVAHRDRFRLGDAAPLRAIFPSWVKELVRMDLARAAFPFEGDTSNSLAVSDAEIEQWFALRGITPSYTLDYVNADQAFGAQSAGALNPFPLAGGGTAGNATVRWLLFAEGTFQYLDGGVLDLGVVRDSSLNAVNKFQIFSEEFNAVAKRGFESLYVTSTVSANGAAAGTVTPVG